jgi:hypothetical protein
MQNDSFGVLGGDVGKEVKMYHTSSRSYFAKECYVLFVAFKELAVSSEVGDQ